MPRYRVTLTRREYSSATVEVEAATEREAKRDVWDEDIDWNYNDFEEGVDEVELLDDDEDDTDDDTEEETVPRDEDGFREGGL